MVFVDGGSENFNGAVDELIKSGLLKRVLTQTEITFSNSMIESWWRVLKHQWLFLNKLDTVRSIEKLVAFYVQEHNTRLPHSAFRGQTPDEMYFGTGGGIPEQCRAKGMFVIHAPSTCTDFYKDTSQRKRAQSAPFAATPVELAKKERWGTAWFWPDEKLEGVFPIDDSDMGCSCQTKCKIHDPWKRQIAAIEIGPDDAITDNGQETWNLLAERKIDNVIILGVHLNMCVLGRPFAIRQQVTLGKNVVLVRDMTDSMYNPEMPPKVSHFGGTDLVVEHVEKYWCPTILSTDLTGKPAFRFKEDLRAKKG